MSWQIYLFFYCVKFHCWKYSYYFSGHDMLCKYVEKNNIYMCKCGDNALKIIGTTAGDSKKKTQELCVLEQIFRLVRIF